MRIHVAMVATVLFAGAFNAPAVLAQQMATPKPSKMLGKRITVPPPIDEACGEPFVHRLAVPSDWVCVSQDTQTTTRDDNRSAAVRRNPAGGPYGADTCLSGFVWRGVVPNDHVCVTPKTRGDVLLDNQANAGRKKKPACEQYARQATASVIDAGRTTCTPTSNPAFWSQNQAEHYDYCMKNPQAVAVQAHQARETGLQDCKVAAANKAKEEREAIERNEKLAELEKQRQGKARQDALIKKKADEAAAAKAKQEAADRAVKEKCENGTLLEQLSCKVGGTSKPAPAKP